MGHDTTRSSRWCSVGSGICRLLLSRGAFRLSSRRVLNWPMHKQTSEVLSQTSPLPLPSQFYGQALSRELGTEVGFEHPVICHLVLH